MTVDDIYLIDPKCQLLSGFKDSTTCEVYNGHIWAAGICISVHNELKNFYEAFYTCKQSYFLMAKVLSPEVNAAILKHLNSDVSYYFLLTGQAIIFSKCKLCISAVSVTELNILQ